MASRRSRIKGIANIPQRRKPSAIVISPAASNEDGTTDNKISVEPNLESNNVDQVNGVEQIVNPTVETRCKEESTDKIQRESLPQPPETGQDKVTTCLEKNSVSVPQPAAAETPTGFSRRRLIKPAVSLRAIKTTPKAPSPEEPKTPTPLEKPAAPENAATDKTDLKESALDINTSTENNNNQNREGTESISIQRSNCTVPGITELATLQNADKILTQTDQQVEIPRPLPPTSPNKYGNRARIKAVPRLGQRRTSFSIGSASESEDESRNRHRIRNDSVCSTTSIPNTADSSTNQSMDITSSPQKKRAEFNTVIQRKCRRTEQSRKLAEARREFQRKFGTDTPDRQKLTMIDLIFYNPSGPGMSQKRKRKNTDAESILSNKDEEVDNPDDPPAEEQKEDEEDAVPAPQITIGADGQIIIDEKSLYIENKDVKKNRETLKNSVLIDGDSYEGGYGVYKKVKRSKDWGKMETLRFYKALNTIGTDFSLMCGLFPGRTRREIKMKFKKEERVNRALIDRAVMQPILYDITELQRDLEKQELEERRKKELENNKKEFHEEVKAAKEKSATRKRSRRSVKQPREKAPQESSENIVQSKLHLGISSLLDSDDEPLVKKSNRSSTRNKSKENQNISVQEQNKEVNHERDIEEVLAEIHGERINGSNINGVPDKNNKQCSENAKSISLQNDESTINEDNEIIDISADASEAKSNVGENDDLNTIPKNQKGTTIDKISQDTNENTEVIDLDDNMPEAGLLEKDKDDIGIEKSSDVVQSSDLTNKGMEKLNFDNNVQIEIIDINEMTNGKAGTPKRCTKANSTKDVESNPEMQGESINIMEQQSIEDELVSIAKQSSENNHILFNEAEHENSKVVLEKTTIIEPLEEDIAMIQEEIENSSSPDILKSTIKEQQLQSCNSSDISDEDEMVTEQVVKGEPCDTKTNLIVPFDGAIQMLKADFEATSVNQEDTLVIEHTVIKKNYSSNNSCESNSNDSDNISNMDECSNDMVSEIIIEQTYENDTEELNRDTIDVVREDNEALNANDDEVEENLEPGSIIVTSAVNANGEEVYTVCTVNEEGKKIPADIAPDVLKILLNSQKNLSVDNKEQSNDSNMKSNDNSLLLPSDTSIDNIMADISLSNIDDKSLAGDCLILPFDDEDLKCTSSPSNN